MNRRSAGFPGRPAFDELPLMFSPFRSKPAPFGPATSRELGLTVKENLHKSSQLVLSSKQPSP